MNNEDSVLALMKSMPSSYRNFLISIIGQTLTHQELITYLLQEEIMIKNLDNNIESSSASSALAMRGKPWNNRPGHSKFQYKPQNKSFQDNKFKSGNSIFQHGNSYRPHNPSYQKSFGRKPLICFYCGKPNHHIRDCRKRISNEANGITRNNSNVNNKELLYAVNNTYFTNTSMWIVDSGATRHMAHNHNTFLNYENVNPGQYAYTIDGTAHAIQGIGNIKIILSNGIQKIIPKVLHVPNLQCNLFLVKQLAHAGGKFCIQGTYANLLNAQNELIASCNLDNDLYILGTSIPPQLEKIEKSNSTIQCKGEQAMTTSTENSILNWYNRLGHVSFSRLKEMVNHNLVLGIDLKHITAS
jgi:hypothetical protein